VTGAVLLTELANRGLWVERRENDLYIAPSAKLTDADRENIRTHKADILTEIRRTEAERALKDTLGSISRLRIHSANRVVARDRMAEFGNMLDAMFKEGEWDSIRYCLMDFERNVRALTVASQPRGRVEQVSEHVSFVYHKTNGGFENCEICGEAAGITTPDHRHFCGLCYRTAVPEEGSKRKVRTKGTKCCPLCGNSSWKPGETEPFIKGKACTTIDRAEINHTPMP
jgi:hypothetical protein